MFITDFLENQEQVTLSYTPKHNHLSITLTYIYEEKRKSKDYFQGAKLPKLFVVVL